MDLGKLKGILATVAPMAASLIGGPLAGTAVRALSQTLLGKDNGTEDEIYEALATADPETLARVKESDNQLEAELAKAGVKREEIHAEDRASARQMQIETDSIAPALIGITSFVGFFGIIIGLIGWEIPPGAKDPLMLMLGVLGTIVVQIANFHFGSSSGSKRKDSMSMVTLGNFKGLFNKEK